jgi:predicted Zn-dependent protease
VNRVVFLISLTIVLYFASTAQAERPTLNVYYVNSAISTSLAHVTATNKLIKSSVKQDFKRKIRIRVRGLSEQKTFAYNSSLPEFSHYYSRIQRGNRQKWAIVYTPPQMEWNTSFFVGRAQTRCWKKYDGLTLATVSLAEYNSRSEPRAIQTSFGALHELGHTLGLKHTTDTTDVMHTGVLYYALNGLGFSESEKFKGKHCLRIKKWT